MIAYFEWMPSPDRLVVVSFIVCVGVVCLLAGGMLLTGIARRLRRRPAPKRPTWVRWARRGVFALAVIGILCGLYGRFVEPTWLEVTHVQVPTDKLPTGAQPIRIVQISDLHCDPKVRLEEKLPAVIADLRPDVICFTGDAVNSAPGMKHFRNCMKRLAAIAPTYAVWGNIDSRTPAIYHNTGVRVLEGASDRLIVRGQPITVAGISNWADPQGLNAALAAAQASDPTILLCHIPSVILKLPGRDVDVCLSGHTHGGQLAVPFYGALITLCPTGKRFEAGLYKHEDTYLYVNRGIGMEGGSAPRVRFFARPEVTVIDLVPAGTN
ncbi:MAG: metallophosphoesterase [Planctomycetota bacterium]|jgi:predicted MPP superfamily phosphohydrolase